MFALGIVFGSYPWPSVNLTMDLCVTQCCLDNFLSCKITMHPVQQALRWIHNLMDSPPCFTVGMSVYFNSHVFLFVCNLLCLTKKLQHSHLSIFPEELWLVILIFRFFCLSFKSRVFLSVRRILLNLDFGGQPRSVFEVIILGSFSSFQIILVSKLWGPFASYGSI